VPEHRILVIMRHAKAEEFGETDHARALAAKGVRDAEAAGSWLARQEIEPDYALVSSATRTVETWKAVADAADWELEPDIDSALFDAGPETALDVIRAVPEDSRTVIFIGHNPTAGYLAQLLDNGTGDSEATDAMARGFPAAALALLEFEGPWEDLELGAARLTALYVPRG
jgi:phosphohistidine phosphatase